MRNFIRKIANNRQVQRASKKLGVLYVDYLEGGVQLLSCHQAPGTPGLLAGTFFFPRDGCDVHSATTGFRGLRSILPFPTFGCLDDRRRRSTHLSAAAAIEQSSCFRRVGTSSRA